MSRVRFTLAALFPLLTFACDAETDLELADFADDEVAARSSADGLVLDLSVSDRVPPPPTGPKTLTSPVRPQHADEPADDSGDDSGPVLDLPLTDPVPPPPTGPKTLTDDTDEEPVREPLILDLPWIDREPPPPTGPRPSRTPPRSRSASRSATPT